MPALRSPNSCAAPIIQSAHTPVQPVDPASMHERSRLHSPSHKMHLDSMLSNGHPWEYMLGSTSYTTSLNSLRRSGEIVSHLSPTRSSSMRLRTPARDLADSDGAGASSRLTTPAAFWKTGHCGGIDKVDADEASRPLSPLVWMPSGSDKFPVAWHHAQHLAEPLKPRCLTPSLRPSSAAILRRPDGSPLPSVRTRTPQPAPRVVLRDEASRRAVALRSASAQALADALSVAPRRSPGRSHHPQRLLPAGLQHSLWHTDGRRIERSDRTQEAARLTVPRVSGRTGFWGEFGPVAPTPRKLHSRKSKFRSFAF